MKIRWKSLQITIREHGSGRLPFPQSLLWSVVPPLRSMLQMNDEIIWDRTFLDCVDDKEAAIGIFNAHTEHIKATIPSDRLLIFNVTEGWPPLCRFLDVPVPDAPFPRANDAAEIQRISILLTATAWAFVGLAGCAGLAAARVGVRLATRKANPPHCSFQRILQHVKFFLQCDLSVSPASASCAARRQPV